MTLMDKAYNAAEAERQVANKWNAADAFHAEPDAPGKPYAIVIPPPNVTAALHMGHALNNTLQDILIRWRRMCGDNAMWMPGTDHAGIATQTVVDKRLQAEGQPALKDYKKMEAEGGGGREQFITKVQAWKDEYEATITGQLKAMGCSCDWDRQRFTMDPVCAKAVREAFFQLFKDGLIYRGKRLVNWDPATQTALADDEVEMKEVDGNFYYLKYPLVRDEETERLRDEGKEAAHSVSSYITVATTRPETFLGDTAVAVNPKDPLRAKFIGQKVRLPIVGRVIPIIGDEYVVIPDENSTDAKAKYASGFLKVTPAHDPNDYEIGRRHGLETINVMAPDGSISDKHGWSDIGEAAFLLGQDRFEARKAIVRWFKENGLLEEMKPYRHTVGHSYRSHVPIEPYLSDQWYVKVTDPSLKGAALRALNIAPGMPGENAQTRRAEEMTPTPGMPGAIWENQLRFHPARYARTFQTWHENIRDWCISRQLWWGHRIPVWTLDAVASSEGTPAETAYEHLRKNLVKWKDQGRVFDYHRKLTDVGDIESMREGEALRYMCVKSAEDREVIDTLETIGFRQDPDVLDTWFSSALWPISTLGWPVENPALQTWNPSDVLCTAREIITLWVSRMVMFNLYFRDCLPFRDVFIHAMIQDGEGQKMSKSLGNGVDPLDIIHSHGADAMRFTLAQMTTQTQDVRMPVDVVCPHTGEAFTPKKITVSGGYTVAAPIQECPTDPKKKMVTSYGMASGQAKPTAEMPPARNTSSKFDNGRNFANKLWNAARFVLQKIAPGMPGENAQTRRAAEQAPTPGMPGAIYELADRWILSRLARTLETADAALRDYQFNVYAQCLYDFFWRDYCDWYVEAVKPNPPGSASDRVLLAVLDASLRLLHPVMPFITEQVWEPVNSAAADRSLPGLSLRPAMLCVKAAWPEAQPSLLDEEAESRFALMQDVVTAIRNIRNQYGVAPRQPLPIRIKACGPSLAVLQEVSGLIQTLSGVEVRQVAPEAKPDAQSAVAVLGAVELYVEGLVDPDAEKKRLGKRLEELQKSAAALKGRLSNPGYADRAPAKLVQQSKDQLAEAEREIETVSTKLATL